MNFCETCHWWSGVLAHPSKPHFYGCVKLTGDRGEERERLSIVLVGVIYTRNDFGCVCWEKRERP